MIYVQQSLYRCLVFFAAIVLISCERPPNASISTELSTQKLEQLIKKNENKALFLSFWNGMSGDEYNLVRDYSQGKNRLDGFEDDASYNFCLMK